jgi:hypothetical protein
MDNQRHVHTGHVYIITFFLCLVAQHALKAHERVEVGHHEFFVSALEELSCQPHTKTASIPGMKPPALAEDGGEWAPHSIFNAVLKRKTSAPAWYQTTNSSSNQYPGHYTD